LLKLETLNVCDFLVYLTFLLEGILFVMNVRVVCAGKKGFTGFEGGGEDSSSCQG
jgi:hypothetical protein